RRVDALGKLVGDLLVSRLGLLEVDVDGAALAAEHLELALLGVDAADDHAAGAGHLAAQRVELHLQLSRGALVAGLERIELLALLVAFIEDAGGLVLDVLIAHFANDDGAVLGLGVGEADADQTGFWNRLGGVAVLEVILGGSEAGLVRGKALEPI